MYVATHTSKPVQQKNWRSIGFTWLSRILALAFLVGGGAVSFIEFANSTLEVHRWHQSELFALAVILLGGTMVSLLWKPQEKPLLSQFFVISAALLAIGIAPFKLPILALFALIALYVVLYPRRRNLVSISHEGHVSIPMIGLTLAMSALLAPIAWREVQWEMIGLKASDVHALELHWIASAILIVLMLVAGLLAATKRPGWKELSIITGATYAYLGVIALAEPFQTGSWGGAYGLFAIIAGIWYILIMLLEAQRSSQPARTVAAQKSAVAIAKPALESFPKRTTQQLVEALENLPKSRTQQLMGV